MLILIVFYLALFMSCATIDFIVTSFIDKINRQSDNISILLIIVTCLLWIWFYYLSH